jgi:hypothetical protein
MKIHQKQPKTKKIKRQIPKSALNIPTNFRHRDRGIHAGSVRV